MAFQKIDENAFSADKSMSAADMQDLAGNVRAAQEARLRSATWATDVRNPLRLCSLERFCIPFLWKLSPRADGMKLRIRHKVGVGTFNFGAVASPLSALSAPVQADQDTQAPGISASEITTTLSLSSTDMRAMSGWMLVFLTFKSTEDTANEVKITNSTTGSDAGHLKDWGTIVVDFNAASGQFGDEIPCAALEFRSYDPSVPTTPAYDDDFHPGKVQVTRADDTAKRLFVWPGSGHITNTPRDLANVRDVAYWIPLSYADVYSVQIIETDSRSLGGYGTAYNAKQAPSALQARRLYGQAEQVLAQFTRVHHLGPNNDPGDSNKQDTSAPAVGWWGASSTPPVNPVHDYITFSGTTETAIATALVNDDDEYVDHDGTTNKMRTALDCAALVAMTFGTNADDPDTYVTDLFEFDARLNWTTIATGAGSVDGDRTDDIPIRALGAFSNDTTKLMHFTGSSADLSTQRLHALRGVYPCSGFHRAEWQLVNILGKDSSLSLSTDGRYVSLMIKPRGTNADGDKPASQNPRRYMHCCTFTVVGLETSDPDTLGES